MEYWALLGCLWGLFALQAVALGLLVGEMGLVCLCQATWFGIGAYAMAILVTKVGIHPAVATAAAPLAAGAFAALLGLPLYRLSGDFFAVATFGVALVFHGFVLHATSLTGGAFGVTVPLGTAGNLYAAPQASTLLLPIWALVGLLCWLVLRWRRSPLGRVLNTMREDETLARSMGKAVRRHRLVALVATALVGGAGGAYYVWLIAVVDPSAFAMMESVLLVAMVVIGGAGSSAGAVLGAGVVILLPEGLRMLGLEQSVAANLRQILFGLGLLLILAFRPRGLLGRLSLGAEQRT